jgi:chromosomal replication initiator protein
MALATSTLWQEILERFRDGTPHLFRAWFYDLSLAALDRGTLVIEVDNESQRTFLESICQAALTQAAQAATERLVNVEYCVRPQVQPAARISALPGQYTFDNFVVGPESNIAYNAALAVAQDPGSAYNPLLLIGPPGSGKTHLLRAIEAHAGNTAAGSTIRYSTSAEFIHDFVKSFECGMPDAFRAEVCEADILLIDDVEALAGKERTLEELFHIYQAMTRAGRQLVFSSSVPIDQAEGLGERLTTRLMSGLSVTLEPPSLETRCLILTAKAKREGIDLPEEVTRHLGRKFETNVADSLRGLQRAMALSQSKGEAINLAIARQALGEDDTSVPMSRILKAVSTRLEVPEERLANSKSGRKAAVARDAAVYLSRRLTSLGIQEIGSFFGGLTPAQVVEIGRRVERERDADQAFAAVLDEIAQEAKNAS